MNTNIPNKRQVGATTLVFSIIVLLLVTFISLNTAKSVIVETRITSNDLRSKVAFNAAEAGVSEAFRMLEKGKRPTDSSGLFGATVGAADNNSEGVLPNGSSFSVSVDANNTITSIGVSDDGTATKTIVVDTFQSLSIGNVPENPWISRGNTTVTGSATIYNQEGASTIWSGGEVTLGGKETYVANPADAGYPACMEVSFTCDVSFGSDNGLGFDVIPNDATLENLSPDQFFQNFFGYTPSNYRNNIADKVYTESTFDNALDKLKAQASPTIDEPNDFFGQNIWIDGDLSLQGGIYGCNDPADLHPNGSITIDDHTDGNTLCEKDLNGIIKPITLIVDGDLRLAGNTVIYGIVYVKGNVTGAGTNDIVGAMIVNGDVTFSGGNMAVWFNSSVVAGTNENSVPLSVSGGWRDF